MNENALKLFHEIMKKGYIDRNDNINIWTLTEDKQNMEDLDKIGEEIGFEIIPAQNRYYLVPTQDNDLFLKNNVDFRRDISGGNDVRVNDLLLMNYLAVYVLYLFFHGESDELLVRDYLMKEDLITEFSKHCRSVTEKKLDEDSEEDDYSEDFRRLAECWLGKKEGTPESRKVDERYGVVNRLMVKFRTDELFTDEDGRIRPTRKLKDLMPYVLRKDRVASVNAWIKERADAAD